MHFPRLLVSATVFLPLVAGQTELPNGPGKETVKRICANCHEIETVTSSRRTKIGWEQMVEEMITRGAEGTDAEMTEVVAYLTAAFGKVNVNAASAGDLEKTLALTEKEAQAIVN